LIGQNRYGEAGQQMGQMDGRRQVENTVRNVYKGIENFPETYDRLFSAISWEIGVEG